MIPVIIQQPFKLYKADNGGIIFEVIEKSTSDGECLIITLMTKECPHEMIYKIKVDYAEKFIFLLKKDEEKKKITIPDCLIPLKSRKLWLSWYNNTIKMGIIETSKHQDPFLEYQDICPDETSKKLIGYIKFKVTPHIDWIVKSRPFDLKPFNLQSIEGGELRWVKMVNKELPSDALIGGFQDEPLYIARAGHNRSLCPGLYVLSKNLAYVPWGSMAHNKSNFQILCGYDATWVKCRDNYVPENVLVAGVSEVNNESLYVGRAMVSDNLMVGKVHMLYKKCYLPYKGLEVEKYVYEILVRGDVEVKGETCRRKCLLNPMKANQQCI